MHVSGGAKFKNSAPSVPDGRDTACWQSVPDVSFRLLLVVTVFLPTGLIVKAQLKNVENLPINVDSR